MDGPNRFAAYFLPSHVDPNGLAECWNGVTAGNPMQWSDDLKIGPLKLAWTIKIHAPSLKYCDRHCCGAGTDFAGEYRYHRHVTWGGISARVDWTGSNINMEVDTPRFLVRHFGLPDSGKFRAGFIGTIGVGASAGPLSWKRDMCNMSGSIVKVCGSGDLSGAIGGGAMLTVKYGRFERKLGATAMFSAKGTLQVCGECDTGTDSCWKKKVELCGSADVTVDVYLHFIGFSWSIWSWSDCIEL